MLSRKNLFLLPILTLLFASCGSDPLDVDVSNITVEIQYEDMRTAMHDLKGEELLEVHKRYLNEIPDIYSYFLGVCVGFKSMEDVQNDSLYLASMRNFRNDKGVNLFEGEIDAAFSNLKPIELQLTDGFKHLKYHLPKARMPKAIVFMNTFFNSSVWCTENEIGIGLGSYLGPNSQTLQQTNPNEVYQWMRDAMKREYLERDVIENWVRTHIVDNEEENLARDIVYEGKVMYLTKAAFPEMADHLILRYTKEQWEWAEKNEFAFFDYLKQNQMYFKNDEITKMNLLNPGPKTTGIPIKGSPDRLGKYLGYKIVCDYMEAKETTVAQMIAADYKDLFQEYKPEE